MRWLAGTLLRIILFFLAPPPATVLIGHGQILPSGTPANAFLPAKISPHPCLRAALPCAIRFLSISVDFRFSSSGTLLQPSFPLTPVPRMTLGAGEFGDCFTKGRHISYTYGCGTHLWATYTAVPITTTVPAAG